MKFILILTSLLLSNIFFMINHPVIVVVTILSQSVILCLLIFLFTNLSWLSIMMYLIFMGGLMILFVYITSLASNEKFFPNFTNNLILVSFTFVITSLMFYLLETQIEFFESNSYKFFIYSIYSNNIINPTIISMVYLLLTLIITVNIIKLYEAPMRSMI